MSEQRDIEHLRGYDENGYCNMTAGEAYKKGYAAGEAGTADEIASLRAQVECSGDVKACNSDVPCAFGALEQIAILKAQLASARKALDLAVNMIMEREPGDSRAVSDEAVALAAVACGDTSASVMAVIEAALTDDQRGEK